MVTQNTTTAAGAAPTGARIRLNSPQANQQVVIDNIAGATLEMGFPSEAAQLEQSGQDLVFLFENGGRIVLSNFFGLFESNQLPAFNLEDGQSLPGDAFLAALREDLLPAAGPGAGAAAGSGGVGDYDDNAGDLIGGVDRLDPLGTTGIGTAALGTIEDEGPLDLATGSLLITINTNISTTIEQNGEYPEHPDAVPPGTYAGVFEDWAPNQHLGSPLTFEAVLGFIFTPTDNEVLDTITIIGPIAGALLVGGVPLAADGAGNFVISAADIGDVTLLPLADSGTDIPLSGFASITDPDSGLTGTVPFTFTAVVDAAADQPTGVDETVSYGPFYCDHGNGDGGNGDGDMVTARVMDSDGDERSFWHHNPHDAPDGPWWKHTAANPTETDDGDHVQSAVKITLSATFGDYQDGSENHFLLIEAKEGWTYDTVNIGGVELDLSEFLTLGADIPASATQGLGVIDPAGYYYVIPVGDESIVGTSQSVDGQGLTHELATKAVTLTLYAPDEDYEPGGNGGYEGNGEYEGPVIATLDQGYNGDGDGHHCGRGNDYKETFVTGALAVDSDADGSLVAVNDNSLVFGSTNVWVAAAEGNIYVTGQQIGYEDPQAYVNEPWYDPFSTKDIDLDFHFSGADDEHLDYLRIAVDVNTPAKVLIFGSEAPLVPDGEGGSYYIVPAHLKDHVTLMPAKDSDVDVKLTVTAVFHDPDSGDVGTDTTQHTVYIDAVADKPIAHDAEVDYTPGPTAGDPGGTLTVTLNATFGDYQDGSERQYVGIEVKHGWSYPGNEGYKLVDGRLYAIYDVTDEVDAGNGSVSLPVTLGVVNTDDRYYTEFKTVAIAKETTFSGVEWNGLNNEAHDTDSVTILVDGADGCLQVSGEGYEDRMHYANEGNFSVTPIKLNIDLYEDDDEVIDSVSIKALGQSFTIVVDGVPTHLSTGQSINVDGSKANSVYIIPEEHNGRDIRIEATATIQDPDSGDYATRSDTSTIVIDAVADKPVNLFETVNYGSGHDAVDPPHGASVSVTATFADVLDGSERHYIGIEYKSGWNYPSGGSLEKIDGTWYKLYDVTSMDNSGTLTKTLNIDLVHDTDDRFTTNFKTVAVAVDSEPGDSDWNGLTTDNNTAYTFGDVDVTVDGADGCLRVSGGGYEDWMPDAHVGDTTILKSALNISFTPDENEVLDNLVVKYDGRTFILVVGENPGDPGYREITLDHWGDSAVVSPAEIGHLYVKTTLNSDRDIPIEVTANYHDPNSGDSGSSTTDHTMVIDAVADKPTVTVDVNDGGDGGLSFQTGEEGSVHVTASFPDTDGSETHWVVLNVPVGFDVSNLQGGTWDDAARTVTWGVGSGGSLDKTITVTQNGAADGSHDFTAKSYAREVNFSGSGLDNDNNLAESDGATDAAVVNSGAAIGWYIEDATSFTNVVNEGDPGPGSGPMMGFTVGYTGYTLLPGESVSIVITGPTGTAGEGDFNNASNNFAAWLNAVTTGPNDGVDYDPSTNTLTFYNDGVHTPPTSLTFYAEVKGDNHDEDDETATLTLSSPKFNGVNGGNILDGSEDGTIIDDDAPIIVPPSGGDEIGLSVQDVKAAGGAQDTDSDNLEFEAGSLPLDFTFDLSGGDPVVGGLKSPLDIDWEVDAGTGNLIGKIGGETAIVLSLTEPADGSYGSGDTVNVGVTVTLVDPLLHASAADITVSGVKVAATDGVSPTVHGTVSVSVDDAGPTATPEVDDFNGGITTNLVIMIDRSGSMDDPSGIPDMDKWEVALEGMQELIDAYAGLGSVNVKIVDFYDGEASSSSWYYDATSGTVTYLNGKGPDGGTSYDAATDRVMADLANGMPPADKSVVYFLSDGNPDPDSAGLDAGEVAAWETFLDGTPIDAVYSFGIGSSVDTGPLGTVAWNADDSADDIVVVDDLNDFTQALLATVPTTGNLLANDSGGADGGLALHSVTVDGVTRDIDDTDGNHKFAFNLGDNKGTLTIDFDDGSYVFTPGSNPVGQEIVNYEVRDADGTLANTTLTLNLHTAELDAHDNYATAQPGGSTESTDTFSNGSYDSGWNGWSDNNDNDGEITRANVGGDRELRIELDDDSTDWFGTVAPSIESSKSFTVGAGDTVSFAWRADATGDSGHDDDRFEIEVNDGSGTHTIYTVPNSGADGSGTYTHTFKTAGTYTVTLRVVDGGFGDTAGNNKHLNAYIDDVVHALAGAALLGNVVTDHAGADIADQIGGQTALVTEVNGVAIANDGNFHDVTGDYGTLSINAFGQYEYHANAGTAVGNDDAFVYKLTGTSDSDYATLNVHIGDTPAHLSATAENWSGVGNTNDFHLGGTGGDTLNGGNGDDVIFGNYGDDIIHGNAGNDILHGNAGNDTIYGDAGNDILVGGQGTDTLSGGGDADTFVWNAEDFTSGAADVVTDFKPGAGPFGENDVLRFADVLLDSDGDSSNGISTNLITSGNLAASGNDAVLTLHHGGAVQQVTLQGALEHNSLADIEQHILNNKIITENS
ncbi:VWA domain-containing protein [Desulfovibrio oxamicus]|uniref:VWA domain-containing protein n=1 Tax=Nitratidesulfovibrio oxamicus TaxID=32016 RepID=A0ABS0J6P4_9BACT|nr:Ig-like domain-containing protein [Nitratidesulfovibrio oxamicus]MBG3878061.1 VWA domain-containing protein [Nitratidesulfovibrio oxamicus]